MDCYSIDDLQRDGKTPWQGVRNFQARNFMRDDMSIGDLALFYHSSSKDVDNPNGVYGIAKVVSRPYVDELPWMMVDFSFVKKFETPYTLAEIKKDPLLADMLVCKRGSRLSIQPVSEKHFNYIVIKRQ